MNNGKTGTILLSACLLLFAAHPSYSQEPGMNDLRFIEYLVNTGSFKEALYVSEKSFFNEIPAIDSLNYLKGWSYYSLKELSSSSLFLLKVSPSSNFYHKSQFFAAYNLAHSGNYQDALAVLEKTEQLNPKLQSLSEFEKGGIMILNGDYEGFKQCFGTVNPDQYELSESYEKINELYGNISGHSPKSPILAGILSGIIPGSGKYYAGRRGEAVSAFIAVTGLGLVTYENYRKTGPGSFRTIAFGSAFALAYTANIYGAVLTVNILESDYQENAKNSILFHLHIPLRNTFIQ